MFKKDYEASWTDLDPNWHVANYAYNKYSTDARVSFFNSLELNKTKFDKLNIGPVLFYEHMYYYKEIKIGVKFSVTVEIDGYSEDGKFFKLFHLQSRGPYVLPLNPCPNVKNTFFSKRKVF